MTMSYTEPRAEDYLSVIAERLSEPQKVYGICRCYPRHNIYRWILDTNGVVIHSPHLSVMQATLRQGAVAQKHEDCRVVEIGGDGNPIFLEETK